MSARERIDVLLVERGLCESRAKAAARVLAGEVVVDDHRVDKPGTLVVCTADIRLKGDGLKWVSRGGTKLEGALAAFVDVAAVVDGAVCVDVGASTGGFTDVLLDRGAARVYAVDVGRAQLHEKLRKDPRVVVLEQTHIKTLAVGALMPPPTLGVVDVSFISLRLVLPAMAAHLTPTCDIVALIKPQFEVGKEKIGKGGIVKDDADRAAAVAGVVDVAAAHGFAHNGTIPSPITGADGNVEFLAWFHRAG